MEITQVTQKSPSVWVLTLADGRSYEIDRTCVLEYALLNRLEIDDETLQEMQQTYCERHALQQALRLQEQYRRLQRCPPQQQPWLLRERPRCGASSPSCRPR